MIATDVPGIAVNFGKPNQKFLKYLSISDAEAYLMGGEFPPGSMKPKVKAAIQFLRSGGHRAVIGSIEEIEKAIAGKAGTEITKH